MSDCDDYDDFEKYLIFGGSLDDLLNDAERLDQESQSDANKRAKEILEGIKEAVSDLPIKRGQRALQRRASLHKLSERQVIRGLDRLTRANAGGIADALRGTLREPQIPEAPSENVEREREMDGLDAALAAEVLGKLPKMVLRAVRLDEISLDCVPDESVKRYFYEAHRCYLYGFNVACVVLCRAVLESAMADRCDPYGKLKKNPKPPEGYFHALVDGASAQGLLNDDRPAWAIKIRDAGNDSIHDFWGFDERWGAKIDEILLNTRKVLLDLYARPMLR